MNYDLYFTPMLLHTYSCVHIQPNYRGRYYTIYSTRDSSPTLSRKVQFELLLLQQQISVGQLLMGEEEY